jgi:hypothetical protein
VTKQLAVGAEPTAVPARRFSHVHTVQYEGPFLLGHNGGQDHRLLLHGGVPQTQIAQFSVPAAGTADKGAQFTVHMWTSFLQQAWAQPRQLRSNGMVEQSHRQLSKRSSESTMPSGYRVAAAPALGPPQFEKRHPRRTLPSHRQN